MSNDRRVSSGRLWRTFHFQSPSRLDKTRLYLVSRQPIELPIPASAHLLRKSRQKQGFITRMKAEPNDQIAGDYCDLFSRWVKEWQSHQGARCRSGSRNLDVAPSRLATGTLPGQRDKGASKNSALNSNNEAQSPSSPYSLCLRFHSKRSRRLIDSAAAKPNAFRMCSFRRWSARSRPERLRWGALSRLAEFWHSLVVSANRVYLSGLRPEPNVRACRRGRHRRSNRERNS
jgi:hypothetical protein